MEAGAVCPHCGIPLKYEDGTEEYFREHGDAVKAAFFICPKENGGQRTYSALVIMKHPERAEDGE
jgi:hypothetical protein